MKDLKTKIIDKSFNFEDNEGMVKNSTIFLEDLFEIPEIKQLLIHSVSNSCDVGDTSILIKGLEDISNWDDEQEEWYDDPGHCANMTLIKYYNSKK
jgi:hypothetical protein